jgi:hypothetical protein
VAGKFRLAIIVFTQTLLMTAITAPNPALDYQCTVREDWRGMITHDLSSPGTCTNTWRLYQPRPATKPLSILLLFLKRFQYR